MVATNFCENEKVFAVKEKKVLSGNFDDIKRYMKSLVSGEHVLVAIPDGSVFRVAKSVLGESSLELVARDNGIHAMNEIKGGIKGIRGSNDLDGMRGQRSNNYIISMVLMMKLFIPA